MRNRVWLFWGLVFTLLTLTACRNVYYSTWEKLGKHKRDLLQSKVRDVRDEQKEASQELKDALTRLQELTGFQGGELEKTYKKLQSDYDSASSSAESVRKRIREMDQIARDLFREWEAELKSISSPELREADRRQLDETKRRYVELYTATKRAETSMEPVLVKFRDYVLYLKHNLNAQAIGALQGEAAKIQIDISKLIDEMNAAIREADRFLQENK
jgi:Skp family chaperone for outer membrane proteins